MAVVNLLLSKVAPAITLSRNLSLLLLLNSCSTAQAQIVPDTTLPNPSQVNVPARSSSSTIRQFAITGGTIEGNNLFHSFESFSIPESAIASFQSIDPDINTVISRVTGIRRSNINGVIETLNSLGARSNADFFLINPNGIILGPNASLNIGGSFVATTAEKLVFADGVTFGTGNRTVQNSSRSLLLTVTSPIGLQFGQRPAAIEVQGSNIAVDPTGFQIQSSLGVEPSQTLALVGGDINISNGILNTQSGRIDLGSVGEFATVDLTQSRHGLNLGYSSVDTFRDIRINQRSLINVTESISESAREISESGAGQIQIRGRTVSIAESSSLLANTADKTGDRLGISIHASSLGLRNSLISSTTFGQGQSGNIRIQADDLIIRNGGQIFANVATNAEGNGGNISIAADRLQISGGITIKDGELEDFPESSNTFFQSGVRASILPGGSGDGGNIRINSDGLNIVDGGQIAADTSGKGDAGRIRIEADEIQIIGVAMTESNSPFLNIEGLTFPSAISATAAENSTGQGGNINVSAQQLKVTDGATIQTSTVGTGNAGNVTLNIRAQTELDGTVNLPTGDLPSGLYSFSGGVSSDRLTIGGNTSARREATGQGGTVSLNTGELSMGDRAVIAVGSLNRERDEAEGAGQIRIRSGQIRLDDGAALLSATASGDGGDIRVISDDSGIVLLRQGSLIESTAGVENAGGNGGNITLSAGFVLAASQENSDIQANAFTGNGGQVSITTQGIFGIEPRVSETPLSDITASSEFGINGLIIIDDLGIDPVQRVAELPTDVAPPPLSRGCTPGAGQGQFVSTGQGGIPPGPGDMRGGDRAWEDISPPDRVTVTQPITEAKNWTINDRGQVVLQSAPETEIVQLACHS